MLLKYLRFIHVDGAFHFIHSADIATLAVYFMLNPKKYREYVLGNSCISIKDALKVLYTQFNMKPLFRIHVKKWFINILTKLFRIKIGAWEKYCMDNSYMIFDAVNPKTFGLKGKFDTLDKLIIDIKSF